MSLQRAKPCFLALSLLAPVLMLCFDACRAAEEGRADAGKPAAREIDWTLRLPKEETVTYQGMVSFDGAGVGASPMLYPAPNVGGFIAALITHGLLLEGTRNEQKRRLQADADRVLLPYQGVLKGFTHKELMQQGLDRTATRGTKRLAGFSETPAGLFVESMPLFAMTQDQSALVLDNAIVIHNAGASSGQPYKNIVRVVSLAEKSADLVQFWTANEGEAIKARSVRLFAESLDLALQDVDGGQERTRANPHRTVRYFEGGAERMERGQIISETCGRVVMRNLRGWLMAVPPKRGPAGSDDPCAATAR